MKNPGLTSYVTGIAAVMMSAQASAQDATNSVDTDYAESASTVEEAIVRRVGPGTIDQPVQLPGPTFQLTAGSGGSEAAVNFKFVRRYRWVDTQTGVVRPTPWTFDVRVSAPLNKDGGYSDVGTIDKFVGSSKLTFGISRAGHPPIRPDEVAAARDKLATEAQRACRLEETASGDAAALAQCNVRSNFEGELLPVMLKKYKKDALPSYANVGWETDQPVTVTGAEVSIGYNEYEFYDPTTLAKGSETHVPYGAKIYHSWLPFKSPVLFSISGEYQHGWTEQKKSIRCPIAAGGASNVTCINGPIGAPEQEDAAIISGSARGLLTNRTGVLPFFGKVGTALTLSYDVVGEQFAADLPIYIIPDDKGALRGGVRFGYKTGGEEKSDFAAALFVGAAFDIFK